MNTLKAASEPAVGTTKTTTTASKKHFNFCNRIQGEDVMIKASSVVHVAHVARVASIIGVVAV